MLNFRRIVIPVDFSEHSRRLLDDCSRWFDGADGQEFHFLHVWEPPAFGHDGDPYTRLEGKLMDFTAPFAPSGVFTVKHRVVRGHAPTQICEYAKAHDCDLIALATHGLTGLSHLLIGSTSENVVRYAPCHVLTVRIPD
jgi:nucleotide-binding universal stress UspA family protein